MVWIYDNINPIYAAFCFAVCHSLYVLTHWGRLTHICVSKLSIFDSDNGLSKQMLEYYHFGPWEQTSMKSWNWNKYIFIQENPFENIIWKMAAICPGLNVWTHWPMGDVTDLVNFPWNSCQLGATQHLWWSVNIGPRNDRRTTSHYLSQCWPRFMSSCDVTWL